MARVLIVDDEDRIRDLVKQYLKFEGFEYSEAANGQQAVELFQKEPCDLIVMDVMMPFMDGISALRMIRESSPVPVILLTAKGEEYDKVLGLELGADDYVVKPFSQGADGQDQGGAQADGRAGVSQGAALHL